MQRQREIQVGQGAVSETVMRCPAPLKATQQWILLTAIFSAGCFPHQAGPRLAHFDTLAPALGDPAPSFSLVDLENRTVSLDELIGTKPVVIRFGSHSCPVYRYRRFSMSELEEDFRDRVHFLLIYTVEAHTVDSKSPYHDEEWDTLWNRLTGVRVRQAENKEERLEQARLSHETLGLEPAMLVDSMDDAVWRSYGQASSPAFVIDLRGKIAARQVWVDPKELRQVLNRLLGEPGGSMNGVAELE